MLCGVCVRARPFSRHENRRLRSQVATPFISRAGNLVFKKIPALHVLRGSPGYFEKQEPVMTCSVPLCALWAPGSRHLQGSEVTCGLLD